MDLSNTTSQHVLCSSLIILSLHSLLLLYHYYYIFLTVCNSIYCYQYIICSVLLILRTVIIGKDTDRSLRHVRRKETRLWWHISLSFSPSLCSCLPCFHWTFPYAVPLSLALPSFHSSSFDSRFTTQPTCHPLAWSPGVWASLSGIFRPSSATRHRIIMSLYVSASSTRIPAPWRQGPSCFLHLETCAFITHPKNALLISTMCQALGFC